MNSEALDFMPPPNRPIRSGRHSCVPFPGGSESWFAAYVEGFVSVIGNADGVALAEGVRRA